MKNGDGVTRKIKVEVNLKVDESGNFEAVCPECKEKIKVAFDNIKDERFALKENIVCPLCDKELIQVFPSETMWKQIEQKAADDILKRFRK
jgi:rubredoxin